MIQNLQRPSQKLSRNQPIHFKTSIRSIGLKKEIGEFIRKRANDSVSQICTTTVLGGEDTLSGSLRLSEGAKNY